MIGSQVNHGAVNHSRVISSVTRLSDVNSLILFVYVCEVTKLSTWNSDESKILTLGLDWAPTFKNESLWNERGVHLWCIYKALPRCSRDITLQLLNLCVSLPLQRETVPKAMKSNMAHFLLDWFVTISTDKWTEYTSGILKIFGKEMYVAGVGHLFLKIHHCDVFPFNSVKWFFFPHTTM